MSRMQKKLLSLHHGVYHSIVMSFSLKNVGATFMRAMTTIFHDIIHKEIEVYVDDVIIKYCKS